VATPPLSRPLPRLPPVAPSVSSGILACRRSPTRSPSAISRLSASASPAPLRIPPRPPRAASMSRLCAENERISPKLGLVFGVPFLRSFPFSHHTMPKTHSDIGLIGLAVMGQNLALNIADHGFQI